MRIHHPFVFVLCAVAAGCGGEGAEGAPAAAPTSSVVATPPTTPPPVASTPPAPTTPPEPPKPTMAELQKKAINEGVAATNAHDPKRIAALYRDDAMTASPGAEGWVERKAKPDVETFEAALFAGYPDMKMATVRVIQKGDMVVWEWVCTGTNTGEFMGEKPTGKAIGFAAVSVLWFDEAGLIKRDHSYTDEATIMFQLGKAPKGMVGRPPMQLPTGEAVWITQTNGGDEAKNVEVIKGFYASFEKKDDKDFLDSLTDDSVYTDYTRPEDLKGKDAAKKDIAAGKKAFPDLKVMPTQLFGAGDYVFGESTMGGTMKGNLGPLKATNKKGEVHAADVFLLKGGKISRSWSYGNGVEFASAFGLMPKPKKPADPKDAKKPAPPATPPKPPAPKK